MEEILGHYFKDVEDPRSLRNQRHSLMTLIGTTLLAVLSGIDSFSGMQDFFEMHFEELSKCFNLINGVPSHDTYQRLWDNISPTQFQASFQDFIKILQTVSSDVINLDGKTIKNSAEDKALHIVSAWCRANQLVLAQEKVDEKSNEITAIPKLLKMLDLDNHIVTMDAMGCQRSICQQIKEQGGDYVISLKGNQGTLHEDVKLYLSDHQHHEMTNENHDKGHGRIEKRVAAVAHDLGWLQNNHDWPELKSIGQVTSTVVKKGKETRETRYYISSLPLTAGDLNDFARSHLGIENKLHWRLDVVFNEDKGCIRNDHAAENMNILRKWALGILQKAKTKPEQSLKSIMRRNSM